MKLFFTFLLFAFGTIASAQFIQCYEDNDKDGYGDLNKSHLGTAGFNCEFYGWVSNGFDCNDNDAAINPGTIWYENKDGDIFTTGKTIQQCSRPVGYSLLSELQQGYTVCDLTVTALHHIDCDDSHPVNNTFDVLWWFIDNDNDGFIASKQNFIRSCAKPDVPGVNYSAFTDNDVCGNMQIDCNDNNALEKPGRQWYPDADNDGYAGSLNTITQCARPGGYKAASELSSITVADCNDNDPGNFPALWWQDADGDGYTSGTQLRACQKPVGYIASPLGNDCDDSDPNNHSSFVFWYPDLDGDKHGKLDGIASCGRPAGRFKVSELLSLNDCNDNDPLVWQSGTLYIDNDADGYNNGQQTLCYGNVPVGYALASNGSDCNDNDPAVNPGTTWYRDLDNDGYSDGGTVGQCEGPPGYKLASDLFTTSGDCDDNNPNVRNGGFYYIDKDGDQYTTGIEFICFGDFLPPGYSTISKGTDCDDNNGLVWFPIVAYIDMDGDGYDNGTGSACFGLTGGISPGFSFGTNGRDCDDNDPAVHAQNVFYRDNDEDGRGDLAVSITGCTKPNGYVTNNSDCNDSDDTIYPGAPELCDGKDNDCNGQTGEGAANTPYYRDADGDGYGNAGVTTNSCTKPPGYVTNNTDCNDSDVTIYPGATDLCDGIDNNCNGQTDEGAVNTTFYRDADGDGFGNPGVTKQSCTKPAGYVTNNTDCNDSNPAIYPGAREICNGIDDNCNGQTDEGVANSTYYRDADGDGFGNPGITKQSCTKPAGYVTNNTDCNDSNPAIYPGAREICNGIDDNCNGQTDEGVANSTYYRDADGDGFGNPGITKQSCTKPAGYVTNNTDCNDSKPGIYPGAPEICNGIDDNCNGQVDELAITNLTTTKITSTSAKLNWTSSSSPTGFQVNYQRSGSTTWQTVLVSGTSRSVTINSLSRNQAYNWRIRALCGKILTNYSAIVTFKTLGNTRSRPGATDEGDIMEIAKKLQIKAWPNPTRTNFTVTLENNDQKTPIKMIVVDVYGRIIEERILNNEQVIRLGDRYKAGVYVVKLICGEQIEQLKLIKLE